MLWVDITKLRIVVSVDDKKITIIITLIVMLLFKLCIRNKMSEIQEIGIFKDKDFETTEVFDMNFSDTKIEEDSFAEDSYFK